MIAHWPRSRIRGMDDDFDPQRQAEAAMKEAAVVFTAEPIALRRIYAPQSDPGAVISIVSPSITLGRPTMSSAASADRESRIRAAKRTQ